jgi:predicted dehydrogenase
LFFTLRFIPETQVWLQRVTELGGWRCGRAEMAFNIFVEGGPFAASLWRREKGALWDLGPHALSLLWPVLGEVHSVVAGAGVGDQVHLIMRHAHGRSSTVSLSLTAPDATTAGTVYVDGESGRDTAPRSSLEIPEMVAAHQKALDALIDGAQRADQAHRCDVHFGARVVEVLAAAQQSLAIRRLVEVMARG